MIDASITHPSAPSLCRPAAARPLAAAQRREKLKESKYSAIARDEECQFVPFVMESYGSLGKQAFKFLKEVSYHSNISLLPVTTIQMVRALSVCLQTGNAFVLLSGCMQAREWKSACRRQRYGLVSHSSIQNEDDDLYPLSDDETDAPILPTQSIPTDSISTDSVSTETETIDLTSSSAAQACSTSSVEVGSERKQIEVAIREMLTTLVDQIVTTSEEKSTRKVDSSSNKRKNSDADLNPNKKQKE